MKPIEIGGNAFRAPQPLARPRAKPKERYRLLKLLGQGGTGAVYKAQDLELDRIIAVKLLHPMLASDERYVDLLRREVVIASQITHPNIVRIFDVSALRKSPLISMAYIQGESLASLLHREGALAVPRIVHFARQICSGLDEAHRRGVVHRDLKPQNLLIDLQSQLFISDFGLAHATNLANYDSIGSSDRPGTLQYMSPEQFHALPFDSRSDLFSFGLILYQMLTGTALDVDHGATGRIAVDRETGQPAKLPETVPAQLAAIVLRCLSQSPAERYQTASEILASMPRDASTAMPRDAIEKVPASQENGITTVSRLVRQHPRAMMAAAFVVVLLIGVGFWNNRSSREGSASPSYAKLYGEATALLRNYDDAQSLEKASALFQSAARASAVKAAFEGRAKAELRLYQLGSDGSKLNEARSAIQRAEKLDPASRSMALLFAEIELAEGSPIAAIARLSRILASEPASDDVLRLLAKAQLANGESSKALETFQNAVAVNPHNWANHNSYAATLMKLGRPAQAEPEFRKVIELDSVSHSGYANLGAAYIALGEFEKAIPITEKALSLRPTAEEYNNLGTALYYTGSCHASLPLFQNAVRLNSRSELFAGNLAEAYRCTGDPERSSAAYTDALRLAQETHRKAPNDPRLTARLGVYMARLGNMDEGQRMVALALKASPENPEIWYSKAILSVVRDQLTEGAAATKTALAHGYSIKEAARDPELKPLWVDEDLGNRFRLELKQPIKPQSKLGSW